MYVRSLRFNKHKYYNTFIELHFSVQNIRVFLSICHPRSDPVFTVSSLRFRPSYHISETPFTVERTRQSTRGNHTKESNRQRPSKPQIYNKQSPLGSANNIFHLLTPAITNVSILPHPCEYKVSNPKCAFSRVYHQMSVHHVTSRRQSIVSHPEVRPLCQIQKCVHRVTRRCGSTVSHLQKCINCVKSIEVRLLCQIYRSASTVSHLQKCVSHVTCKSASTVSHV